jgi:stage II sporulation protein D
MALLPAAIVLQSPAHALGSEPVVRVLLRQAGSLAVAAGPTPLKVEDRQGRVLLEVPAGASVRLQPSGGSLQAVVGGARSVSLPLGEVWFDPEGPGRGDELFVLDQRKFRGRLKVRFDQGALQAINYIGVESYLPSVVGSEMPASWPQEALRAQAVAARTYALRQLKPAAPFDLTATVSSQVYKGVVGETASTRQAVASTRAKVLMHGNDLINAVFHSSSGGATENSGEVWSRQLPYLVSVPDFDDRSPVREWEKRFQPHDLVKAFPEIGGVRDVQVVSSSANGRIRTARVVGPRGSLVVKGAELRKRLDLRSTWATFDFDGSSPAAGSRGGPTPLAVQASGAPSRGGSSGPRPVPLPVVRAGESIPSSTSRSRSGSRPVPRTSLSDLLETVASSSASRAPQPVREFLRQTFRSSSPSPRSGSPALVVRGRGFGHGVGMSQWGAYGLAVRGEDHEDILRHFYRGAQLRPYPSL